MVINFSCALVCNMGREKENELVVLVGALDVFACVAPETTLFTIPVDVIGELLVAVIAGSDRTRE